MRAEDGKLGVEAKLAAFLLLLAPTLVCGQQFAIDWFAVACGGGVSAGGQYSVSGTIGQADAGFLGGGSFMLAGGFWGLEAVTPAAVPQLRIRLESGGSVIISWPNPSTGFHLETASGLTPPLQWIDQGEVGTVV